MSKLTLTFDMELERESAHNALHADQYHSTIWDINEVCRCVFKYGKDPMTALQEIYEIINHENL